jgi:hypothetical protein
MKALEINKRKLGEDHANYASILGNLSVVLEYLEDYEGAK